MTLVHSVCCDVRTSTDSGETMKEIVMRMVLRLLRALRVCGGFDSIRRPWNLIVRDVFVWSPGTPGCGSFSQRVQGIRYAQAVEYFLAGFSIDRGFAGTANQSKVDDRTFDRACAVLNRVGETIQARGLGTQGGGVDLDDQRFGGVDDDVSAYLWRIQVTDGGEYAAANSSVETDQVAAPLRLSAITS